MKSNFVEPEVFSSVFSCPTCGVVSHHNWYIVTFEYPTFDNCNEDRMPIYKSSECAACSSLAIWKGKHIVFPDSFQFPPANDDLPNDILKDYLEAGSIYYKSPRGAAALLRLCVQKLCIHLGGKGKNLNDDIASLVKNGLPVQIKQALDVVRVIGNESVHPGQMYLNDDRETVTDLFGLINQIVQDRITQPKMLSELYDKLPEDKRKEIDRRDSNIV